MINERDHRIHERYRLSLSDIHRVRDLRLLLKFIKAELSQSPEDGIVDEGEIFGEKVVLQAVMKELHKRERRMLFSDLETQ